MDISQNKKKGLSFKKINYFKNDHNNFHESSYFTLKSFHFGPSSRDIQPYILTPTNLNVCMKISKSVQRTKSRSTFRPRYKNILTLLPLKGKYHPYYIYSKGVFSVLMLNGYKYITG